MQLPIAKHAHFPNSRMMVVVLIRNISPIIYRGAVSRKRQNLEPRVPNSNSWSTFKNCNNRIIVDYWNLGLDTGRGNNQDIPVKVM